MKIGVFAVLFGSKPFEEMLDYLVEQGIEVHPVFGHLHADRIVRRQRAQQFIALRQALEQRWRREGDVEKEADRAANARIAQGLAEWKQVIVVHPDRVIGPQQRHQRFGECRVHRQVCGQFGPAEFGETDTAMQQRPQHAISEAAVVALVVGLSQADRGKRNAAGLHDVWRERRCTVRDVPGPAEPQAIALVGSVAQRDSKPAGRLAALAWRWHSIGDDHQSGHF